MKQKYYSKKYYLLWLFLLSIFCLAWIVSITSWAWVVINTKPTLDDQHRWRLHSLFLWDAAALKVYSWSESLTISGWLIIWSGMNLIGEPSLVMIWGWENNNIWWKNSWIAWWERNTISDWNDSAIWGGSGNYVEWENAVVVWGSRNTAENRGIVVWWYSNTWVDGGIILWWYKNYAEWNNSLVMWKNSTWLEWSFSWNANNSIKNSARIDVQSGVLIWTYWVKIGTRLVVSGAIKLWESKYDITWAIQLNNKGCLMMYDGSSRQVFGKLSEKNPECNQWSPCEFGNTIAQEWDIVTGYFNYYARDCRTIAQRVICRGWKFYSGDTSVEIYPYCYDISLDKSLDTNSKNTICKWLIPNAHRVNGYFKQRLEWGVWTPTSSPKPQYTSDSNESCSYQCNDGFSFIQDPDRCTCDINIEYDCNEWKGGGSTGVEYGNRPTTLSKDACSREGYELVWWSWDKNAENPDVSPGAPIYSLVQCKNYTLYAVRKKSYTITYDCNGWDGNPPAQHVVCGEQAQLSSTGCTKENAKLIEWKYNDSIPGLNLHSNRFTLWSYISPEIWICQSFTLHAQYECKDGYTLKNGICVKLQCHHCSKSGFPYCFPINFDSTCNEGNYLN